MIAIAGGKGGCGKTTTTVAIARAIVAGSDSPVIGVEGDWDMPDLRSLAQTAPLRSLPVRSIRVEELRDRCAGPGVTILEAPETATPQGRQQIFERVEEFCGGHPAQTVIDCPAGAGRDAAVPIEVASGILLVSTAEPASLRDTAKTAAMAEQLGSPVIGAVITGADTVPEGAERLLGTSRIIPIPDTRRPLRSPEVRRTYEHVVGQLEISNIG
ncbi:nucleotide-binding protein [Natranaeroarchaeum sulfidigenes]|uniref:Putative membrane protein n=1 Tax=Natranaeroarchaeum sulfidigenes TaxID=2784880 RepID=A0A897MVB0_9EURY|nr:cobyrinic acid ac-diamide synthase [Natranaeroarchaeum sulfidigenes]QSG02096.1 putative membrane protein [Natranaeroarchaeum sulfidigenes]